MESKVLQVTNNTKTSGEVFVDEDVYEWASKYKWHVTGGYVRRSLPNKGGKTRSVSLHREITSAPKGMLVDHINGNTLDNRKCNLRVCTHSENARNQRLRSNNTSGYKGVYIDKRNGKWYARYMVDVGKSKDSCMYDTPEEAARVYDYYALKYYGEFSRLNFPDEVPDKPKEKKQTSSHKGIWWCERDKVWQSQFQYKRKRYTVGSFKTEEEAVKAYKRKRKEVEGKEG